MNKYINLLECLSQHINALNDAMREARIANNTLQFQNALGVISCAVISLDSILRSSTIQEIQIYKN